MTNQANINKLLRLKAKMLCNGVNACSETEKLIAAQNPFGVKRGGLSSGAKMYLDGNIFVNAPLYKKFTAPMRLVRKKGRGQDTVRIIEEGREVAIGKILAAPAWYAEKVNGFPITKLITAHKNQLAMAVWEDCALFKTGKQCKFCVMKWSQSSPELKQKSPELIVKALRKIPVSDYKGIILNSGMTAGPGRGMEIILPFVQAISEEFPKLTIAVEITPPEDLDWIDRLADAGCKSLMMNLEMWDPKCREKIIPGKNELCPRDQYLKAFDRALKVLGGGRVSTCFVVGTEPIHILKQGIREVVSCGVIPSPLVGRNFEDIPGYDFHPHTHVWYEDLIEVVGLTAGELRRQGITSTDQAGCIGCGMCDMIRDMI